jgi:ankyrin repeat protein
MMRLASTAALCVLTVACGFPGHDPREELAKIGVAYSPDALVAQAGAGDTRAVELLLASGMHPGTADKAGSTALLNASAGGYPDVVRMLLDHGADPNQAGPHYMTPLMAASWTGNVDVVKALLAKGASVEPTDDTDDSALMLAVRARRPPVVKLLLDAGAKADTANVAWTALQLASFLGDVATVNLLLAHGVAINARTIAA